MAKGYEQQQYEKRLSEAASLLAGEVPAGKERDYLIELSRRFKPKPEYADGTIAWITAVHSYPNPRRFLAIRREGMWCQGESNPDTCWVDNEVSDIKPLRVLGDDEIAVKRVPYLDDWEISQTRSYGGELRSCGNARHLAAARLVENYADALEAEAIQAAEAANQQIVGGDR